MLQHAKDSTNCDDSHYSRIAEQIRNPDYVKLAVPALKGFLGLSSRSTFFKWKNLDHPKLDKDKFERISLILGIYKALQILFSNTEHADNWMKNPNQHALFMGLSPLSLILSTGSLIELYKVRNHLDSLRGIW
jgi:uncharacterized protein (DUF2384 family)